jgi:hypothetical protein
MNKAILKPFFYGLLISCAAQLAGATVEAHSVTAQSKQYRQMNEQEQIAYLKSKLLLVAQQMTKQGVRAFPDEAISLIKYWLDAYARRIGTGHTKLWQEDLRFTFKRAATQFTPTIIAAFEEQQVPTLLGVYIPMIETEYRNLAAKDEEVASGLFNFIGPIARRYGVAPSERTNVGKMATAAARYLKERFAEFGTDITGIELSLTGYIRAPSSVRRDLKQVADGQETPTFWTLVKNKKKLDYWFQNETINYVPRFYAVAIIGENLADFGLEMKPLSTYTKPKNASSVIWGEAQPVRRRR